MVVVDAVVSVYSYHFRHYNDCCYYHCVRVMRITLTTVTFVSILAICIIVSGCGVINICDCLITATIIAITIVDRGCLRRYSHHHVVCVC